MKVKPLEWAEMISLTIAAVVLAIGMVVMRLLG